MPRITQESCMHLGPDAPSLSRASMIQYTSTESTTIPPIRPSHSCSAMAQPHTADRIATATPRQSGPILCLEFSPARNHSRDVPMPPGIQCRFANSAIVLCTIFMLTSAGPCSVTGYLLVYTLANGELLVYDNDFAWLSRNLRF